ncbi:hypothetical protein BDN72DRAFT_896824 [Pluteus cervinus]|uniref:Uncharacterized protein n=1 Tax=Pluteus cervinus TaxID=181527 RepID=A0ACD3AWD4_9AGAR|nr:hypothetical protein BDN72DRAFT_896824 [Pluteus cervinus]
MTTQVLERDLHSLLKWHPELSYPPGSKGTTPPSKFSQHLDDGLILKRIVYDPQIIPNLCKAVDDRLQGFDIQTKLRSSCLPFPQDPELFEKTTITSESQCVDYYDKTLSPFYAAVATALVVGQFGTENNSVFSWTARDTTEPEQKGNIPDGVLRLNDDHPAVQKNLLKHLKGLATWEFKRPQVLDNGLRKALQKLIDEEEFRWCRCTIVNASNVTTHEDKCLFKQHFTPEGAYLYNLRPLGPDALPESPVNSEDDAGGPRFRPIHSTTLIDKAHSIFQQLWTNGVMGDFTYTSLDSVEYQMIGLRHRASQTLFVTGFIKNTETKYHTKIAVGLYFAAWEDALKRDALIDSAIMAQSKQFVGCSPENRYEFETIVRHWKAPSSKPPSYGRSITDSETDVEQRLRQCHSIFLVAPIPQKEGACHLILPELPYIWLRVDPETHELWFPPVNDEDLPDIDNVVGDVNETGAEDDGNHEEDTEEEEDETQSDVANAQGHKGDNLSVHDIMKAAIVEESAPYADRFVDELDHPSSQPSSYCLDGPGSVLEDAPTFNPTIGWDLPPADSIEVFTTADISHHEFNARVRFDNRYLLDDRITVKIYRIDLRKKELMKEDIAKLQQDYEIMKTTQERTKTEDNPFTVYGVFAYKHAIRTMDKCPETGGRLYRLATLSRKSRKDVPARYFAILTTSTGRSLSESRIQLTPDQIAGFAKALARRHTEGYLHGNMNRDNLRIMADGSLCIIGWTDTAHYVVDMAFKIRGNKEAGKLEFIIRDRQDKLKASNLGEQPTPSSSRVKVKRKAEDRISQDRELKKLIPDGEGSTQE